jgi:hypothetical protein
VAFGPTAAKSGDILPAMALPYLAACITVCSHSRKFRNICQLKWAYLHG